MELGVGRTLWTGVVYHDDYREDEALAATAERIHGFAAQPCAGVPALRLTGPGVFGFDSGEVRATRELMGVASDGIGWSATVDWLIGAMEVLHASVAAGVSNHGSLDPHRLLIQYDGEVQILGFGLPRLDLVDFLDDPSLLPLTESLRYTAPESLEGTDEDVTTDLFILGLIACRLATGNEIYTGKDAKELLSQAADGEARTSLEEQSPPASVLKWLGPMLAPWPEERHKDVGTPLDGARACRKKLKGPSLAQVMEAHAETASSVEIDLPRGWKLPPANMLEASVDPALFEEERVARIAEAEAQLAPLEAALKGVDKALAKLVKPPDWGDTPSASERRDEARQHGDRARAGGRSVREVIDKMRQASDSAALEVLAETLDEAVAQARGGAEEGERTAISALQIREEALEARAQQEANDAVAAEQAAAIDAARATLKGWADEAIEARDALPQVPPLEHSNDPSVQEAVAELEQARADAATSTEALLAVEIEPTDEPRAVLDAVSMHLDAVRDAGGRAQRATEAVGKADKAAQEQLEAREEAAEARLQQLQSELAATGERVSAALARVVEAHERAAGLAQGLGETLTEPLGALIDRLQVLRTRRSNWKATASETTEIEALEEQVHTGTAEAEFAEADVEDLSTLVEAFDIAHAAAVAEREAYENERGALQARLDAAAVLIKAATEATEQCEAFVAPDDIDTQALDLRSLEEPAIEARAALELAAAVTVDREGMPEVDAVSELERQGQRAREASAVGAAALVALKKQIGAIREDRLQVEEARKEAVRRANALLEEVTSLLVDHAPPEPSGDVAIDDRLQPEVAALVAALAAFPKLPEVDIETDPVGAIGALETAADVARQAEARRVAATEALSTRRAEVQTLVGALAKICQDAEDAADDAARLAAQATDLTIDLQGRWPGLKKDVDALTQRIAAMETHAKAASAAAEATAAASDTDAATAHAADAKAAADAARKGLKDVSTRSGRIHKKLEVARSEQATDDETARQAAVGAARALQGRAEELQGELDAAIQQAGELLEGSPSIAAKQAWQAAEAAIDATQRQLASLVELQDAAENAVDREQAESSLGALRATLEPVERAVGEAAAAAGRAAELAAAETEANVTLFEKLHDDAAELGEQLRAIHEAIEHSENHVKVAGVRKVLKKLHEQLEHAQNANDLVNKGINSVNHAGDAAARSAAAEAVKSEMARVVACRNTAGALRDRVEALWLGAAEADAQKMQESVEASATLLESTRKNLEQARERALSLADARAEAKVEVATAEADLQLQAVETALAEVAAAATAVGNAETGASAVQGLARAAKAAKQVEAAVQEHDLAVGRAIETHQALLAGREAERHQRIQDRLAAIAEVREVHRRVAAGLSEAEAKLNEALNTLPDLDLDKDLEPVRQEASRLGLFLEGLPGEIGPDGLESTREVAERAKDVEKQADLMLQSFDHQLGVALNAAEALAGIRDAAGAVRTKYADLESQLAEVSEGLDSASTRAPVAAASLQYNDAREQLVELQTTLREAQTSLQDLNSASDADEAKALLEVAEASLDIAASLFEFAVPVVKNAVNAADAEASANVALQARRDAAQANLKDAHKDLPDATSGPERVAGVVRGAEGLEEAEDRGELESALQALLVAGTAWEQALAALLKKRKQPKKLEALEEFAALRHGHRLGFDQTEQVLAAALQGATDATDEVRSSDADRRVEIERIQKTLKKQRKALALVHDEVSASQQRVQQASDGIAELEEVVATHTARAEALLACSIPIIAAPTLAAARSAQSSADALLDEARDGSLDELERAVVEAAQAAKEAAADRHTRAAELRGQLATVNQAFSELITGQLVEASDAIRAAEPWPLETLEAADALQSAVAVVQALSIPEPQEPIEATAEHLTELEGLIKRSEAQLKAAQEAELAILVVAVRSAITGAERAAQTDRDAVEVAQGRVADAREVLSKRQLASGEALLELQELLEVPELEESAQAFQVAVEQLAAISIEGEVPNEREEAEAFAASAEATSKTPIPCEELAQALRAASGEIEVRKEGLRKEIGVASEVVQARLDAANQLVEEFRTEPASPRLDASIRALEEAAQQISAALIPVPEADDLAELSTARDEALFLVHTAEAVDTHGLAEEARGAVEKARAEAAATEHERASTQEQASAAVDASLLQLTMEVEARRDAVGNFPDDSSGSASPHRSRARDALEAATGILSHLESLQQRLREPMDTTEAVSATFDAESQMEIARQHLDDVDAAVDTARTEVGKLGRIRENVPRILGRIRDVGSSMARTLGDLPEGGGEAASALQGQLFELGSQADGLVTEANQCAEQLEVASTAFAAETEQKRLIQIEQELIALAKEVRQQASDLRDAVEAEQSRVTAKRAETFAEGQVRADLAVKRAEAAAKAIGAVHTRAAGLSIDTEAREVAELLTQIAGSNAAALNGVSAARDAAGMVDEDIDAADEAVEAANGVENALGNANHAITELVELAKATRDAAHEGDEQAEQEQLERRDSEVEQLRGALDELRARMAPLRSAASAPMVQEEAEEVRQRALSALEAAANGVGTAAERLELLASAKALDVQDFLEDARGALSAAGSQVDALESVRVELEAARDADAARGEELAIEEARGRAWEASQLARKLSKDLTMARNALPPLPEPLPTDLREAADVLADVERRLSNAGQRADEAREQSGTASTLEDAVAAADAAEDALGGALHWEKEIDVALDRLSTLLKGPGNTRGLPVTTKKSSRMQKLRRGKSKVTDDPQERLRNLREGGLPFAPVEINQAGESPTERLLQRLRKGRVSGETGRERLKRLRQQRKARDDAEGPPAVPTDGPEAYPSVADLEEHKLTVVAGPTEDEPTNAMPEDAAMELAQDSADHAQRREQRAGLISKMKERRENAADHNKTQVFTRRQLDAAADEDVATQMFTREMLNDIAAEIDDADPTQASAWQEEDPSTKYSTLSPKELADRKKE